MAPCDMVKTLIDNNKKWTERAVAQAVKTSQPTIHRIYYGSMPSWDLGERIKGLYQAEGHDLGS